ncbi:hypothetical protein ASESINO_95 [Erwinia phage vB_EamM_Asesino]|uniref:Uncharacterized protein n=1 Tax=Erwinia phage vB_EamM_Asesino TaxID=1883370 RepID=A0A1B2IA04_9CAUD|nr:hypothetical protein ASESINO_95 [Erwinia phage vB_EamM_Asesino]ANZ48108.1 hypothetical protein ASESINO_95 [Erwinia phage vB_EamM_Asesino]
MSITIEEVTNVLKQNLSRDNVLNTLNSVMADNGMPPDQGLKIARAVGIYAQAKKLSNQQVIQYIIDAYKAAVYQSIAAKGKTFSGDVHDKLMGMWGEVEKIIAILRNAQGGGGLGGGGIGGNGGGIRVSDGLTMSAPEVGVSAQSSAGLKVIMPQTDLDFGGDSGLSFVNDAPTQQTTVAPQPAAAVADPATAPKAEVNFNQPVINTVAAATSKGQNMSMNDPVINILQEIEVEDYAAHELVAPEAKISVPAKEANSRIKQSTYAESRDWVSPLQSIISGEDEIVFYKGAGIIVRARDSYRPYLVGTTDSSVEVMREFLATHNAAKSDLDGLTEVDDVEKLMDRVMKTINKLRQAAKAIHDYSMEKSDEAEVVVSEVARFANAYLGNLTLLIHNGISLATNHGTDVPTVPGINLERAPDDINWFAADLYNQTTGGNGVSEHEDFFRDLFLTVANSIRKLTIKLDDKGQVVNLVQSTITVVVPGLYQSVGKYHMVEMASLGNASEPLIAIYEALQNDVPHSQVILQVPQGQFLLLSNGEPTAPVRY